ncbi:MAG: alpha/beta hydrolase [Candidatus Saccharimonadales bacterium]
MDSTIKHILIYSHGFGVRKEDRGLFTSISKAISDATSVMFDMNPIHESTNTLTVKPLHEQAGKLRKVINQTKAEHPDAIIDLVCHSQGCVVAALLKPRGIRKVIMITPPEDMTEAVVVKQMSAGRELTINVTEKTRIERSDGSTTVIRPEYWQSLAGVNAVKLYNLLARVTTLRIIGAKSDEVLGKVTFNGLDSSISHVTIEGGHNFEEEDSRKQLLYILKKELLLE